MTSCCLRFLIYSQLALFVLAKHHVVRKRDSGILGWIDPLIGSRDGGNVFAGATLPYGMAKGGRSAMRDCEIIQADFSKLLQT